MYDADQVDTEKLVWVDVETSGLDPDRDLLLEVGFCVTDLDFQTIAETSVVVGYRKESLKVAMDTAPDVVVEMHRKNGLWHACADSKAPAWDASDLLSDWVLENHLEGQPLCGSSLALDRGFLQAQMPGLHKLFHYRSIDNSSTKELCRRFNPDVYAKLEKLETDHRVMTCLPGTIAEAKFYADNFLFVEEAEY